MHLSKRKFEKSKHLVGNQKSKEKQIPMKIKKLSKKLKMLKILKFCEVKSSDRIYRGEC